MIAQQAYKGYPKLTETETVIANLIMKSRDGIHINNIIKKYPGRNFAVRNALQRLEAFKIAFSKNFVWYIEPQFQMEVSKKAYMRKNEVVNTNCVHRIDTPSKIEPEHELCSGSLKTTLVSFLGDQSW